MRRLPLVLLLVLLVSLACQKGDREAFTGERGGELVVGSLDEPTTLNPIYPPLGKSIGVDELLFLSLYGRNSEGKIVPQLAYSWEYAEDFRAITFYLRKDVKWSDGADFTAEDVAFTFDLIKNPEVGSPLAASVRFIDSVKVINPYKICFYFSRVYADELLDAGLRPLPKHILKDVTDIRNADFNRSPIGNGPYVLESWERGQKMILAANENFYRGEPPLEKVHFWFASGEEALAVEMLEGNIDIVTDVSPSLYERIKDNEDIDLIIKPGNTYTYIGWNLSRPLFGDLKMRRALTAAIDRERLVNEVILDLADIAKGPIPPTSWAFDEELGTHAFDPEQARQLLDELGWKLPRNRNVRRKDREQLRFILITNKENPIRIAIANFVAANLAEVGIQVTTEFLDTPTFIARLIEGDFDAFILGWSVKDRIDPTMVWNSDPEKGKFNLVSYRNSRVDSMIDMGLLTLDRRETKKIWAEFQRIIAEEIPNTFLFYPKEISAANRRVKGIEEDDARFILANLDYYWIPGDLRTAIDIAALGENVEEEEIVEEEEETKPEEPIVNPEELLEKKAVEEVVKETAPVSEEGGTPAAEGEVVAEGEGAESVPTGEESTVVETEPEPEIPPTLPKIRKLVVAAYPEAAKLVGAEGTVFVQVVVGIDGKVKGAKVVKSFGNPSCEAAALAAARATEWIPGTKNGQPAEMTQTYPIRFPP
jgi:peptide/nickel transport system substrate-binding protein